VHDCGDKQAGEVYASLAQPSRLLSPNVYSASSQTLGKPQGYVPTCSRSPPQDRRDLQAVPMRGAPNTCFLCPKPVHCTTPQGSALVSGPLLACSDTTRRSINPLNHASPAGCPRVTDRAHRKLWTRTSPGDSWRSVRELIWSSDNPTLARSPPKTKHHHCHWSELGCS